MKKIIIAIFAHPDDEAFGPSGTLLSETKSGAELHLISLTDGDAGTNQDNHSDLGTLRLQEWRNAGTLMGATGFYHLGMTDGHLGNADFLQAIGEIETIIKQIAAAQDQPYEIELISNDLNGITGHIDHIVAARAACFIFYTLQRAGLPLTKLRLACIPHAQLDRVNLDWLFMESGRLPNEIDETVDARHYHDEIIAIMRAHHSQRGDGEEHIKKLGDQLGLNYFIVRR